MKSVGLGCLEKNKIPVLSLKSLVYITGILPTGFSENLN